MTNGKLTKSILLRVILVVTACVLGVLVVDFSFWGLSSRGATLREWCLAGVAFVAFGAWLYWIWRPKRKPKEGELSPLVTTILALVTCIGTTVASNLAGMRHPHYPAYRECWPCGVTDAQVNQLIDDIRHSMLDREGNLELLYATFESREDAEACLLCAEAILDAAGT